MKRIAQFLAISSLCAAQAGCDLFDPTETNNPDVTEESVVGQPGSLGRWVTGLERQAAIVFDEAITTLEIGSDNYDNTQTFFNQGFDRLLINYTDDDVEDILFSLSDLRETSVYGREVIAAADPDASDAQIAETYFFEGLAALYIGELFVGAPNEGEGPVVGPEVHLNRAVSSFQAALDLADEASYRLALARAYYGLGDQANAVAAAEAVLSADPEFVRFADFDPVNDPASDIQDAIYDRGSFDDLQPLPRLDFLDPKYNVVGTSDDPIAYLKAEEAHLILIEARLADGDLSGAQDQMNELLDLVESRPLDTFSDAAEGRTQQAPGSRPDSTNFVVRASPDAPFREGLVLDRGPGSALVTVPSVSGTSVTEERVDEVDSVDDAVALLYLLRQEIFIAEGRRFSDLGLRMPVHQNEVIANPNLEDSDPATQAFIPPFVQAISEEIDAFTIGDVDGDGLIQVTILHDLNEILSQNRTSDAVVPFF